MLCAYNYSEMGSAQHVKLDISLTQLILMHIKANEPIKYPKLYHSFSQYKVSQTHTETGYYCRSLIRRMLSLNIGFLLWSAGQWPPWHWAPALAPALTSELSSGVNISGHNIIMVTTLSVVTTQIIPFWPTLQHLRYRLNPWLVSISANKLDKIDKYAPAPWH